MCGRFSLQFTKGLLAETFGIPIVQDIQPRYNIAPSQQVLAIRQPDTGREAAMLRWGLIPFWAEDASIGNKMINARAETVISKPAFRAAFRSRRCLIPANGFFEWQHQGKNKRPFYIITQEGGLMAFGGLWEHWKTPDGEIIESCTIITTDTNELLQPIHTRMPVIIDQKDYDLWLDQSTRLEKITLLLRPYPSEKMKMIPVGDTVNSPRNDKPECIKPI